MKISEGAINFIKEQAAQYKEPVVVMFQRTYRGWCGESTVNSVEVAEKAQIREASKFVIKKFDGTDYSVYVDKNLESLWNRAKVDIAGWSSFQRLVLVQD